MERMDHMHTASETVIEATPNGEFRESVFHKFTQDIPTSRISIEQIAGKSPSPYPVPVSNSHDYQTFNSVISGKSMLPTDLLKKVTSRRFMIKPRPQSILNAYYSIDGKESAP